VAEAVIFNPGHYIVMDNKTAAIHFIDADSSAVFEQLFKSYFKSLHSYALSIVKDEMTAEEMVQNVFCRLWEKREQIQVLQSMKSYLYRAVHNESINYLRQHKTRAAHHGNIARSIETIEKTTDRAALSELQQRIHDAVESLPEQCRMVFRLSRYGELDYREIAETMGITVSTVKNQVHHALKVMRIKLKDYLPLLLLVINLYNF
jgi:RNA polymerase sigma-70 factor (ECF subfamily)